MDRFGRNLYARRSVALRGAVRPGNKRLCRNIGQLYAQGASGRNKAAVGFPHKDRGEVDIVLAVSRRQELLQPEGVGQRLARFFKFCFRPGGLGQLRFSPVYLCRQLLKRTRDIFFHIGPGPLEFFAMAF